MPNERQGDDAVNALARKLERLFDGQPKDEAPDLQDVPVGLDDKQLAVEFHHAMVALCRKAAVDARYNPNILARMIQEEGGLAVAKRLAMAQHPSEGFQALWERGRLDLAVEFLVCSTRYQKLFSESEIRQARRRLQDWGLDPDTYF